MTGCIGRAEYCQSVCHSQPNGLSFDKNRTGYQSFTVTAIESIAKIAEKITLEVIRSAFKLMYYLHSYVEEDFRAVATYEKTVTDHRTGRKCAVCNGVLLDTIVNFGEFLPTEPLERAKDHSKKADLCLVLGSSLTIPPASTIPEAVGKRKSAKLAICNLQTTPLDPLSDLRIYAKADDLMIRVMEKLNFPIPEFILHRRLVVEWEIKSGKGPQLTAYGVDVDGTHVSFLRSVKLEYNRRLLKTEPFVFTFRGELDLEVELKLNLEFMGHYGEPNLELVIDHNEHSMKTLYLLAYNPQNGEWKTIKQGSKEEEGASVLEDGSGLEDASILDNPRPAFFLPQLEV